MLLDAERLRHKADYGRRSTVSVEEAQRQIVRAEQFLELGNRLIATPLYRQLYQQYVQQIRTASENLSQEKLDQLVAFVALKAYSESAVKSILKHSLIALVRGDEYVQQTLAIAQSQVQEQKPPTQTHDHEQDLELE